MRLLVLGGTMFLGRAVAEHALAGGHAVTLFHRGHTNAGLFPAAEHRLGDRDGGLAALDGATWDAVVDTSGYVPRLVRDSARRLASRTGTYLFVSSISAYDGLPLTGADEDHPLRALDDPAVEEVRGDTYGGLKVACERAARSALGDRAGVIRPGLIVGPHDSTDRFSYWPRRMARGGEVLAPGPPDARVQLIDARDLAQWIVRLAERGVTGTFNAIGPATPLTMGGMLEACREAAGTPAAITWVDEAFLLEQNVEPWSELPLWTPGDGQGHARVSNARALAAGLTFRPLVQTARDTLAWDLATPAEGRVRRSILLGPPPLTAERERELLAQWKGR